MGPSATSLQQTSLQGMKLPVLVFGRVELRRLGREIEAVEGYFDKLRAREAGQSLSLPKISRMLEGFAGENNCNLLVDADRNKLKEFLKQLDNKAPVMHLSFATEPSSAFVAKIVSWMRLHIHPYMLLQLGLQPGLTAGCAARVNSKLFDLSLREFFKKQRPLLIQELTAGLEPSRSILSPARQLEIAAGSEETAS